MEMHMQSGPTTWIKWEREREFIISRERNIRGDRQDYAPSNNH